MKDHREDDKNAVYQLTYILFTQTQHLWVHFLCGWVMNTDINGHELRYESGAASSWSLQGSLLPRPSRGPGYEANCRVFTVNKHHTVYIWQMYM